MFKQLDETFDISGCKWQLTTKFKFDVLFLFSTSTWLQQMKNYTEKSWKSSTSKKQNCRRNAFTRYQRVRWWDKRQWILLFLYFPCIVARNWGLRKKFVNAFKDNHITWDNHNFSGAEETRKFIDLKIIIIISWLSTESNYHPLFFFVPNAIDHKIITNIFISPSMQCKWCRSSFPSLSSFRMYVHDS